MVYETGEKGDDVMKKMAQQFITQKLKQLTVKELLQYSRKYRIPITEGEAQAIVQALKKNKENPFEKDGRKKMLKKLAGLTSADTARSVNKLLHKLAKEYGVEDWLK